MKFCPFFVILFLFGCGAQPDEKVETPAEIVWQSFNKEAFERAERENKLVFLEVGANWCHWCHVMDDSTYSDKAVKTYLNENFILCREDSDERPDLYSAYRAWGWPAIIVFDANGTELLKLKGYQYRTRFLNDLKTVRANPVPLKNNDSNAAANANTATEKGLYTQFMSHLDHAQGGYDWQNKSLVSSGIRLGLCYYDVNDSMKNWVDLTVANSYLLQDPAWGGIYQYSAKNSWNNQHYEKLLRIQADYIEAYCLYAAKTKTTEPLAQAEKIVSYCNRFLGNDTPLYSNSQNADLVSGVHSGDYYALSEKDRLAQGTPRVDQKQYLKENAAMIVALGRLWAASEKETYLEKGIEMLDYILVHSQASSGLFMREQGNEAVFSFEDNRQLLDALILYYQLTQNQNYLSTAKKLAYTVINQFYSENGMRSACGDLFLPAAIVPKENISAVLTFNTLGHLTELDTFKHCAAQTFAQLDKTELMRSQMTLPLLFRAEKELKQDPFHAQYIADNSANKLREDYLKAILLNPNPYFIFDVLTLGKMEPADADFYGNFDAGTLFMCTSSYCSSPIYAENDLKTFLMANELR